MNGRPQCEVMRPDFLAGLGLPISEIGRLELEIEKGEIMVNQYFALERESPANYAMPEIDVGYSNYFDFVKAQKRKDKRKMTLAMKRICDKEIAVNFISAGRDGMSIAASNYEKAFFDLFDMNKYVTEHELAGVRILNPSKGTVKRLADSGLQYDIVITPFPNKKKYEAYCDRIDAIMLSVNYSARIMHKKWGELDPDYLYYMSFSADKGEENGVTHFIGFEMDPYSALVKGRQFSTVIMADDYMDLEYVRHDYTASMRFFFRPYAQRVPIDLTIDYLKRSPKWFVEPYNGIFTILTTLEFDVPNRPIQTGELDPIGLQFCSAYNVYVQESIYEVPDSDELYSGTFIYGTIQGEERVLDINITEVFSQRQEILRRLQLPLAPWSINKRGMDNYAAHPSTGTITELVYPESIVCGDLVNAIAHATYDIDTAVLVDEGATNLEYLYANGYQEIEDNVFATKNHQPLPLTGPKLENEYITNLPILNSFERYDEGENVRITGYNDDGTIDYLIIEAYKILKPERVHKKYLKKHKFIRNYLHYFTTNFHKIPPFEDKLPRMTVLRNYSPLFPRNRIQLGTNIRGSKFFSFVHKGIEHQSVTIETAGVFAYSLKPAIVFFEDPGGYDYIFQHTSGGLQRGDVNYAVYHDPYVLLDTNLSFFDAVTSGDYFSRETWSNVATTMTETVKKTVTIEMNDGIDPLENSDDEEYDIAIGKN